MMVCVWGNVVTADDNVVADAFFRRETVGFWSRMMISGMATVGMLEEVVISVAASCEVDGSSEDDGGDSVLGANSKVSVDLDDCDEVFDGNSSVTGGAVYVEYDVVVGAILPAVASSFLVTT